MNTNVEKLEHSMVRLTIEVDADKFEMIMGKADNDLLKAANSILDEEYPVAIQKAQLDVVALPSNVNILQMELGKPFIFTVDVAVKPEVSLGQYKGIEIEKISVDVTEEELTELLIQIQETNPALVVMERPIKNGDIVDINYAGTQNGVAFEGGTAEGYDLEVGSHSFIDGFEEQLIGHVAGDEFDIHVTFPDPYHAPELAGKPAVFAIKVNEVKEKFLLPLDDQFAQLVAGFETLEDMKAEFRKELTFKKENEAALEKRNAVLDKIIENTKIDVPQPMIETEARNMFNDMASNIQNMGVSMEDYLNAHYVDKGNIKTNAEDLWVTVFDIVQEIVPVTGAGSDGKALLALQGHLNYNYVISASTGLKSLSADENLSGAYKVFVADSKIGEIRNKGTITLLSVGEYVYQNRSYYKFITVEAVIEPIYESGMITGLALKTVDYSETIKGGTTLWGNVSW